jgi:acetyl esterase
VPIHPYIRSRFPVLDQIHPGLPEQDLAGIITEFEADPTPWNQPDLCIVDDLVDGPHGPVPIRLYAPDRRTSGVVTWIHGGAFMTGGLDMNESHVVAAELAVRADVAVVTVDYRLARSGVRFPVPLDDAYAVWRWAREEFAPGSAVTVLGGASAGATLAVAAAMRDRDSAVPFADALFLAYPYLHFPLPAPEPELAAALSAELHPALRITARFCEDVVRNYVGGIVDVPTGAIPGSGDLHGLPPTRIVVAEYDDLRTSGELFFRQLCEAETPARISVAAGMPHGFLNRTPWLDEVGRTISLIGSEATRIRSAPTGPVGLTA